MPAIVHDPVLFHGAAKICRLVERRDSEAYCKTFGRHDATPVSAAQQRGGDSTPKLVHAHIRKSEDALQFLNLRTQHLCRKAICKHHVKVREEGSGKGRDVL